MTGPLADVALCGWRVRSAIALPELPLWHSDDRAPDVEILLGDVPPLDEPVFETPVVQLDAVGRIRFAVQGVCDYRVEGGSRITLAPKVAPDSRDVRLFLLASGLGYLCHQREIVPLRAATVEIEGRAVLLAAGSGAGKSTLAAEFLRRGHRILSDDIAPLDARGVLPGIQRIRLWRDSAERAGWPADTLDPCREGMQKLDLPLPGATAPVKPAALFHLLRNTSGGDAIDTVRLRGADAVGAMRQQTYRWRTLTALLGPSAAVRRVSEAAVTIPQHFTLARPVRQSALGDTVDAILDAVRGAA